MIPFVSPLTKIALRPTADGLLDPVHGTTYPVINGVPRFCSDDNYSQSFGLQWNLFDSTQLDVHSGSDLTEQRFYLETGWDPRDLDNASVLEVGCGAGRFSEVFLRTTSGVLYSVDYSNAVDANRRNNAAYGKRLQLAQASIYELPFDDNRFDKVFCLGVLQHTPSFSDSVAALIGKACVGGEIVVDFYPIKGWYTRLHSKYLLRPITKRLPKLVLLRLIRLNISWMMMLFDSLCNLRLGLLTRFIPITDLRCFPSGLPSSQKREWAVMDTFDAFSPAYDNPQCLQDVVAMFTSRACEVTYAGLLNNGAGSSMVVRALKQAG